MVISVLTRIPGGTIFDKIGTKTTDHHKTEKQVSASHVIL